MENTAFRVVEAYKSKLINVMTMLPKQKHKKQTFRFVSMQVSRQLFEVSVGEINVSSTIYSALIRDFIWRTNNRRSSELPMNFYCKRGNPPSFDAALSPSCNSGAGSANSRIMNMIISHALLTGSRTCPAGVTLRSFPPSQRVLTWRPVTKSHE